MSKHTAGPWTLVTAEGAPPEIIAPGVWDICVMSGAASNESVMADARLIAAAPDLLRELEQTVEVLSCVLEGREWGAIEEYIDSARAAIAKAEGKKE